MVQLDGPRVPAASGTAKQMVILCHGYGANGDDLIGLARPWQRLLPDAVFVSPHAPEPVAVMHGAYQWFPVDRTDPETRGVILAAPVLDGFIDEELERLGFNERQLALVGFSQGAIMALHVGVRRPFAPAAVLGYSGMLADPMRLKEELRVKPPVLLIHGDADPVIPVAALHAAVDHLDAAGLAVQWHVSQGVPHSIDPEGVALGGRFLADSFAFANNPD